MNHQQIQYCTTTDGVRLAYSVMGKGSPIVRAAHWLTHLEYDLKSPVWRHFVLGLAHRHTLIRYDARGEGLSQRDVDEISFDKWLTDLETVVDAAKLDRFILLGVSQGASVSIAYAVRHPERVSHLILHGGFARGFLHAGDPDEQAKNLELTRAIVREGWGREEDAYRQWFTSQFIPEATAEQARWFNELERVSATAEVAERHLVASAQLDVAHLLPEVRTPTLVTHARGDLRIRFWRGQELAVGIPGAKFVPLEGKNHLFLANEPAHRAFFDALASFLGDPPLRGALPGSRNIIGQVEDVVRTLEQNWLMKIVAILAAVTGLAIFFVEVWKMWR
ncbi:MAG: alpha/beta fold hydrolase [Alphaproteobacteria bacterium]|nr:alpha/beta fold hydrolase [Alphaproteobacteria bacterium]